MREDRGGNLGVLAKLESLGCRTRILVEMETFFTWLNVFVVATQPSKILKIKFDEVLSKTVFFVTFILILIWVLQSFHK